MDHRQLITPTCGPHQIILIGSYTVAIGGYFATVAAGSERIVELTPGRLLLIGCLYGWVAAGCWLATAVESRWLRLVARAGLVIAATWALSALRETRGVFQTAADFTGLALVQSLLFFWFRLPSWRSRRFAADPAVAPPADQYSIADVIIVTTLVAILLALAIRFSPAIDPVSYWLVLISTWIACGLVSYAIARGLLTRRVVRAGWWLLLGIGWGGSGVYAIAAADSMLSQGRLVDQSIRVFAGHYGLILVGFFSTFLLLAALGRLEVAKGAEVQTLQSLRSAKGSRGAGS